MSANMNWIDCICAIGRPNWLRAFTQRSDASSAASAPPSVAAPSDTLPMSSVFIKVTNPIPTWPNTFSFGTRTSSKFNSEVGDPCSPIFRSGLPAEKPGQSVSTTKQVAPPRAPSAGSVTASTITTSAIGPLVIHIFCPSR